MGRLNSTHPHQNFTPWILKNPFHKSGIRYSQLLDVTQAPYFYKSIENRTLPCPLSVKQSLPSKSVDRHLQLVLCVNQHPKRRPQRFEDGPLSPSPRHKMLEPSRPKEESRPSFRSRENPSRFRDNLRTSVHSGRS